jgi:hypothetical protein
MPSVAYGAAKHFLKDSASAVVLTPQEADGTAMNMGTTYASPLITDISVSVGGTIKEFVNYQGEFAAYEVSGEYVDVTFTIIPTGTNKAGALLSSHQFRKGTPFAVTNAPVLKLYGHKAEGSPDEADILNGDAQLQSMETRLSLEGETTGTITLRYYFKQAISPTLLT